MKVDIASHDGFHQSRFIFNFTHVAKTWVNVKKQVYLLYSLTDGEKYEECKQDGIYRDFIAGT